MLLYSRTQTHIHIHNFFFIHWNMKWNWPYLCLLFIFSRYSTLTLQYHAWQRCNAPVTIFWIYGAHTLHQASNSVVLSSGVENYIQNSKVLWFKVSQFNSNLGIYFIYSLKNWVSVCKWYSHILCMTCMKQTHNEEGLTSAHFTSQLLDFIKRWLREWLLEFIALGLSFRKVGPGVSCTTMHWCILRAPPMSFWRNEGVPCYPIHPTSLI
jgi:hypothetical protein